MLKRVLAGIDLVSEWSGRIVCGYAALAMSALFYEVCARYLFHSPTMWAAETARSLQMIGVSMGAAYTLLHRKHVTIDMLARRLKPRPRAILDAITFFIFLSFVLPLIWWGWVLGVESVATMEHSGSVFNPPVYPVKILMLVGCCLLFLQGSANFIRNLKLAVTGKAI